MLRFFIFTFVGFCFSEKIKLTVEELEQYDGRNGKIYLACSGLVFDVTGSPAFKPKASYSKFAGKDATVAFAKHSFDNKWIGVRIEDAELTESETKSVKGWVDFLEQKYAVVGEIVNKTI